MALSDSTQRLNSWSDALSHMRSALYILDQNEAPAQIGAHLDLAISQLEQLAMDCSKMSVASKAQLAGNA